MASQTEIKPTAAMLKDTVIRKGQMVRVKLFDGKNTEEIAPSAYHTPFNKPGTMHVLIGGHIKAAMYPPLGIFVDE